MSPSPAVSCNSCGFAWNSSTMAEGLRILGSCPKCGGVLTFRDAAAGEPRIKRRIEIPARAPHLVLGIPRR
jgi:hypothetical protein